EPSVAGPPGPRARRGAGGWAGLGVAASASADTVAAARVGAVRRRGTAASLVGMRGSGLIG
ncbi:hypothetical protein AB0J52_21125, partial [Spirillospora sp. NPDC049652]